jgi:hypothetical protein
VVVELLCYVSQAFAIYKMDGAWQKTVLMCVNITRGQRLYDLYFAECQANKDNIVLFTVLLTHSFEKKKNFQ